MNQKENQEMVEQILALDEELNAWKKEQKEGTEHVRDTLEQKFQESKMLLLKEQRKQMSSLHDACDEKDDREDDQPTQDRMEQMRSTYEKEQQAMLLRIQALFGEDRG